MTDRDAVRRGYDHLAERYAAERSADETELSLLADLLDRLDAGARVLDAGCGAGDPILARAAGETTAVGLDVSREQLRLAAGNAPGAALARGDLTALPFDDDAFDAVVAYHSLIHVPLPDHPTAIEEFGRVLRPGGDVLISEGRSEWAGSNPDWLDGGAEMQWSIAGEEATRAQLGAAGFDVVEVEFAADELADDDSGWLFFLARLAGAE